MVHRLQSGEWLCCGGLSIFSKLADNQSAVGVRHTRALRNSHAFCEVLSERSHRPSTTASEAMAGALLALAWNSIASTAMTLKTHESRADSITGAPTRTSR